MNLSPEQIQAFNRLRLQDGDVLLVQEDMDPETIRQIGEALIERHPGMRLLFCLGSIEQVPEATMNAMGWYRQP